MQSSVTFPVRLLQGAAAKHTAALRRGEPIYLFSKTGFTPRCMKRASGVQHHPMASESDTRGITLIIKFIRLYLVAQLIQE